MLLAPLAVVGTGIIGLVVLVVVVVGLLAWYRARAGRADAPPELGAPDKELPAAAPDDRPTTWDPRERYDGS
jgi:hypothetical protein